MVPPTYNPSKELLQQGSQLLAANVGIAAALAATAILMNSFFTVSPFYYSLRLFLKKLNVAQFHFLGKPPAQIFFIFFKMAQKPPSAPLKHKNSKL
jgi:hypothetical protein